MEATFRALCEHGYADLSIAKIAEKFDKSKSLLYYHYDSKDDLLAAFLGFAIDHVLADLEAEAGEDPMASLHALVDTALPPEPPGDAAQGQRALTELRMQAVTDEAFRERMTRQDERLVTHVHELLTQAADAGLVEDTDLDRAAEHVQATLAGGMFGRATTDRPEAAAAIRESLHDYLDGLCVPAEDD